MAAGPVVDELANEYLRAGKSVPFLEHNVDATVGNRYDRWTAAYGGSAPADTGVPLDIVDSGYRASYGWVDFRTEYRAMVEAALERPAGAEIYAGYTREADNIELTAAVTNRSGTTLNLWNSATLHVLVWERAAVIHTERFVRAGTAGAISADLPDGQTATFRLRLEDVPVTQWQMASVLVLLDYRPDQGSTKYDMLQAVVAVEGAVPTRTPIPTITPTRTATPTPTPGPSPTPTEPLPGTPIYLPRLDTGL